MGLRPGASPCFQPEDTRVRPRCRPEVPTMGVAVVLHAHASNGSSLRQVEFHVGQKGGNMK